MSPARPAAELQLNFRDAPLEMVVDYLAEAAGFTVLREVGLNGRVTLWSGQPTSVTEALGLLDTALLRNGYAAIREGKILKLVMRADAKTRGVPVSTGANPDQIPATGEIVTQVMPLRFSEASAVIKDLQPLLPAATVMTANESANAIVLTGSQSNIRRAAQAIQAIESRAEDFTVVKVFHLKNADPAETVDLLTGLFPDQGQKADGQTPVLFGGGPPGGAGFGPGPPDGAGASDGQGATTSRLKKAAKVVAVADPRTGSIVVSAPRDLIGQIQSVIEELDRDPARKQRLALYQLKNASSQSALQVLQDIFQKNGATDSRRASALSDPLEARRTSQSQSSQTGASTRSEANGALGGGASAAGGAGPGP